MSLNSLNSGSESEREGRESQHVGCSLPPLISPSDLGNALSVFFCPPPKSKATEAPSEPPSHESNQKNQYVDQL